MAKSCAEHYSYDIHGNVKTLIQENPSLSGISQDLKRIDYEFDLVSGKINQLKYQDGEVDAFYHKYEYDADNRITNVYTSKDNVIWEQDAKYFYYLHGGLARTELGDQKVQAMDYAYTLQGWIKGVNSNTLDATRDIGKDGEENINNLNRNIGRDAFGYSLNYFTNDYTPIGTIASIDNFIASTTSAAYLSTDAPDLFNGNISSMVTTIRNPSTNAVLPQLTAYRYDQLNRIKQMKAYRDINLSTNVWGSGSTYDGSYEEHYTYNANGSILGLTRNGLASIASGDMDAMTYKYETVANGYTKNTNKLRYILDAKSSGNYADDMDNQGTDNYDYDEIGNLIKDDFECIQNIEWTLSGKVKKVTRTPSCTTEGSAMPDLEFNYDASENLIEKIVKPEATLSDASTWIHTYYVLNAQGHIMATYEKEDTDFILTEQQIYGSSHIGTAKRDLDMSTTPSTTEFSRTLGKKQFFLTDHRGNNNVTVLDRKKPIENIATSGTIAYFEPVIDRAVDYFPFGREQNGRIFNRDESEFGYNGKPNVKEWSARLSGAQNYGARIKFGEGFLSEDQLMKKYPGESPYSFAGNSPIVLLDNDGNVKVKCTNVIAADGSTTSITTVDADYVVSVGYGPRLTAKGYDNNYQIDYDVFITTTVDYSQMIDGKPSITSHSRLKQHSWTLEAKANLLNKTAIVTNDLGDPAANTDDPFGQFTGNTNPVVSPNARGGADGKADDTEQWQTGESGTKVKPGNYDATGFNISPNGTSGKRFKEGNIFKDEKGDTSVVWNRTTGKSTTYKSIDASVKQSLKKWTPLPQKEQ